MDTSSLDPALVKFVQQVRAETEIQKFNEQVHGLNNRCWDICIGDSRPPSKLDGKTQTCIANCVNRMIDASAFIVQHLNKIEMSTPEHKI